MPLSVLNCILLIVSIISCETMNQKAHDNGQIIDTTITRVKRQNYRSHLTPFTLDTYTYTALIHPSMDTFHFVRIYNPETGNRVIEIYTGKDPAIRQIIDGDIGEQGHAEYALQIIDANFDGYKDILHLIWSGATGNMGYSCYLFDSLSRKFVLNPEFSGLGNARFDYDRKRIYSSSNGGMAGMIFGSETYTVENGKLKLIHAVYQDFDDSTSHYIRKTKHMKNGILQDSATVIFPPKHW